MKKIKIIISVFCSIMFIGSMLCIAPNLKAVEEETGLDETLQNDYYYVLTENGDIEYFKYDDFEYDETLNPTKRTRSASPYSVAMIKGYTTYTNAETGLSGYTHGASATDAAYIKKNDNGTIRIKQAGTLMDVPANSIVEVPYTGQRVSNYTTSNGKLFHNYIYSQTSYGSTWVGYQPEYLNSNSMYYSYDGHYFYTNYKTMIDDYKAGNYNNSINKNNPYYNYYQFLSHRSKTNFTADMFNKRITDVKGTNTNSKLKTAGADFINSQNKYGTNASLMYGVSINESGWGLSKYSLERNNLFGHNAVDSNPDNATKYNSVAEGIDTHARNYISTGYLNPADYRYHGPHLGDKQSGLNVKYASDPYWGEKAAQQLYHLNESSGMVDSMNYSIAGVDGNINLYNNTSSSKKALYSTGTSNNKSLNNNMVLILGEEIGADGNIYYKIQSDTPLNDSRTVINTSAIYKESRDYVYIRANVVKFANSSYSNVLGKMGLRTENNNVYGFKIGTKVTSLINSIKTIDDNALVNIKNASGVEILTGTISTGMTITIKEKNTTKTYTIIVKGDVDGDGSIFATDYVRIKNHIMGKNKINGVYLIAADVNKDGSVYATDYVKIKNHIMGKGNIEQ